MNPTEQLGAGLPLPPGATFSTCRTLELSTLDCRLSTPIRGRSTAESELNSDLRPRDATAPRAARSPVNPSQCALTKNGSATPLECALSFSLDLKCPGINTYGKHRGVEVILLTSHSSLGRAGARYSNLQSPAPHVRKAGTPLIDKLCPLRYPPKFRGSSKKMPLAVIPSGARNPSEDNSKQERDSSVPSAPRNDRVQGSATC